MHLHYVRSRDSLIRLYYDCQDHLQVVIALVLTALTPYRYYATKNVTCSNKYKAEKRIMNNIVTDIRYNYLTYLYNKKELFQYINRLYRFY